MKLRKLILFFVVTVFLNITISACSSNKPTSTKLPQAVENLIANQYSHTTYSIESYQKAPYPENYPGFAGTTAPKDEVWCIVVQSPGVLDPQDIYHGVIAHRLGGSWSTAGPSYQTTFEQLGCSNYK